MHKRVQRDIIGAGGSELVSIKRAIEVPEPTNKLETAQTLTPNFDDPEIKRIGFSVQEPPAEG